MQVDTNFSEADIGRIEKGQKATLTVDAYPERNFRGEVLEIRNAPQTIQNVVTYDVVIQMENKDLKLKPGMTANVTITVARREGVLKLPNTALRFQPANVPKETGVKEGTGDEREKGGELRGGGRRSIERITEGLNLTLEQQEKLEMIVKAVQSPSRGTV